MAINLTYFRNLVAIAAIPICALASTAVTVGSVRHPPTIIFDHFRHGNIRVYMRDIFHRIYCALLRVLLRCDSLASSSVLSPFLHAESCFRRSVAHVRSCRMLVYTSSLIKVWSIRERVRYCSSVVVRCL